MNLRVLAGGGGATSSQRVAQILEHRPKMVVGTPTYLLHLADAARDQGLDVREAGVEIVAGGGEPGLSVPVTRQKLMDEWGATQVIDGYGIGETMHVGVQLPRVGGWRAHLRRRRAHGQRPSADRRRPLDSGQVGENIVTSYTHFSQPFIKYRTHDLVQRDLHPDHGCGWTWAHLPGVVLGRSDYMVTIRGTNVYPTAAETLIGAVEGLSSYDALPHQPSHVLRRVARQGRSDVLGCRPRRPGAQRLDDHLRRNLGVRLGVDVVEPDVLPRYELKSKRIFDTRSTS